MRIIKFLQLKQHLDIILQKWDLFQHTYVSPYSSSIEGSCLIDVPNKTIQEIKINNGDTAYKASIDPINENCYYVKRCAGFEMRNIQVASKNEYSLLETNKIILI